MFEMKVIIFSFIKFRIVPQSKNNNLYKNNLIVCALQSFVINHSKREKEKKTFVINHKYK